MPARRCSTARKPSRNSKWSSTNTMRSGCASAQAFTTDDDVLIEASFGKEGNRAIFLQPHAGDCHPQSTAAIPFLLLSFVKPGEPMPPTVTVAVDAMGGDHAPDEVVRGVAQVSL